MYRTMSLGLVSFERVAGDVMVLRYVTHEVNKSNKDGSSNHRAEF